MYSRGSKVRKAIVSRTVSKNFLASALPKRRPAAGTCGGPATSHTTSSVTASTSASISPRLKAAYIPRTRSTFSFMSPSLIS